MLGLQQQIGIDYLLTISGAAPKQSRRHQDMALLWLRMCWSRAVSNPD